MHAFVIGRGDNRQQLIVVGHRTEACDSSSKCLSKRNRATSFVMAALRRSQTLYQVWCYEFPAIILFYGASTLLSAYAVEASHTLPRLDTGGSLFFNSSNEAESDSTQQLSVASSDQDLVAAYVSAPCRTVCRVVYPAERADTLRRCVSGKHAL